MKLVSTVAAIACFVTTAWSKAPHWDRDIKRSPSNGYVDVQFDGQEEAKTISCESRKGVSPSQFRWYKIGPDGKEEVEINNNIEFASREGELTINTNSIENGDLFRCKLDELHYADFEIVDQKIAMAKSGALYFRVDKFQRSYSVVENEDLKVNCTILNKTAEGYDAKEVVVRWYMWDSVDDLDFEETAGNCSSETQSSKWIEITEKNDSEEPHIKFLTRDGINKGTLKIEDAVRTDRRGFKCVAYNSTSSSDPNDCSESTFFVRVKDKYAALWPFVGIVAEVFVLIICIMIAEKRRANKQAAEEEEEEDGPTGHTSNPSGDKNTVRQRRQ